MYFNKKKKDVWCFYCVGIEKVKRNPLKFGREKIRSK